MTQAQVVTINGEEYRFKFTISAIMDAQKLTDRTFGQLLAALGGFDVAASVALVQAALRHADGPRNKKGQMYTQQDAEALVETWIEEGFDLVDIDAVLMAAAESSGLLTKRNDDGEKIDDDSPKEVASTNGGMSTDRGPIE